MLCRGVGDDYRLPFWSDKRYNSVDLVQPESRIRPSEVLVRFSVTTAGDMTRQRYVYKYEESAEAVEQILIDDLPQ